MIIYQHKRYVLGRIIAITNQKGGVGKTTTAINLASYLTKLGQSVLVVDLDPQGNTTTGLGIDKSELKLDIYDALVDGIHPKDIIRPTAVKKLSVLPATSVLAAAEVDLVHHQSRELRLKQLLQELPYDYVLIDCPPSLGLLTINGLAAATSVLVPVQAEFYALEGLGNLLGTIQMVQQSLNPQLELMGVLVTMHNGRTTLSQQVYEDLKTHFPNKVFDTIIPRNVRLAEAPSFGRPISHYDKWSKGAKSYRRLAEEVHSRATA